MPLKPSTHIVEFLTGMKVLTVSAPISSCTVRYSLATRTSICNEIEITDGKEKFAKMTGQRPAGGGWPNPGKTTVAVILKTGRGQFF